MVLVALLVMGSAILLFSCKSKPKAVEESLDAVKTEESEHLTIIMSENGRKSYLFKAPLLEGYMLGRDPYREFRKGISITTYQDDSLTTVNAVLEANYAIYYENRKLWEAKGDVVITKHDGTRLYTQQLFWNSITKRIYSNVDTKLVTDTDEVIGEGFESDEDMNEPRFRRWKGRMEVDTEQLRNDMKEGKPAEEPEAKSQNDKPKEESKVEEKKAQKSEVKRPANQPRPQLKPQQQPNQMPNQRQQPNQRANQPQRNRPNSANGVATPQGRFERPNGVNNRGNTMPRQGMNPNGNRGGNPNAGPMQRPNPNMNTKSNPKPNGDADKIEM